MFVRFVHRPLSHYVNGLIEAGLVLRRCAAAPPQGFIAKAGEYEHEVVRTTLGCWPLADKPETDRGDMSEVVVVARMSGPVARRPETPRGSRLVRGQPSAGSSWLLNSPMDPGRPVIAWRWSSARAGSTRSSCR